MLRSGTCGAERGFGSLVQQCWLFGAAAAVIVPCAAYTDLKHQERKGLLSRDWLWFLFVFLVCLLCAVCLAAWLAITSAVVLMTARAMLQSVLRRSEHDNCSRAIVAAATDICRVLPFACLYLRVCLCLCAC